MRRNGALPLRLICETPQRVRNRKLCCVEWLAGRVGLSTRIDVYFEAWNETDPDRRRALLERCAGVGVELIDPTGRFRGIDGLHDRIGAFPESAPGARS